MAKVRVYELAKELGVESKVVLTKLNELGEFVRSASSTVEAPVVRKLREAMPAAPAGGTSSNCPDRRDGDQAEPEARRQARPLRRSRAVGARAGAGRARDRSAAGRDAVGARADRSRSTARPFAAAARHAGTRRAASRRGAPPVEHVDERPGQPGTRPAPRPGGPRPGNNPFTSGSTGMPRPGGPRPGNNPFTAGGTQGMQRPGAPGGPRPPTAPRPGTPGRPGAVPGAPRPNPGHDAAAHRALPLARRTRPAPAAVRLPAVAPADPAHQAAVAQAAALPVPAAAPAVPALRVPRSAVVQVVPVAVAAARPARSAVPAAHPDAVASRRSSVVKSSTTWTRRRWVAYACRAVTARSSGCPRGASLTDFAERIDATPASLVSVLFGLGEMVTATESVNEETLALLGTELNYEVQIVSPEDEDRELLESFDLEFGEDEGDAEDLVARPPVVTVMGHVDHGKTKLLDAIRSSDIVAGEAGGITQHIGAYQVHARAQDRAITFIDTPGHEAFTAMRARGSQVTDIVILVVAADDGVKPQTIEALNHAQAAGVPIVVAVNKIDKDGADPEKVRGQLTEYGLVAEEYGGDTMFVDVSATQRIGLDELLDAVLLTADAALELTANPNQDAQGVAIEAHLDKGRGPVATVLVQRGTLRVGDSIVAGEAFGRVRAMFDEHGDTRQSRRGRPVRCWCSGSPRSPTPATTCWSCPRTGWLGRSPSVVSRVSAARCRRRVVAVARSRTS